MFTIVELRDNRETMSFSCQKLTIYLQIEYRTFQKEMSTPRVYVLFSGSKSLEVVVRM